MSNTYPNQKIVKVSKAVCDKNNSYATINLRSIETAMTSLKGEAFKLWFYLAKNRDKLTLALSSSNALASGIGSKSSYDRAIKELEKQGYLVVESGNKYTFYDFPQNEQRNNK